MNDQQQSNEPSTSDKTCRFLEIVESHKRIVYKVANSYCRDAEDRKDLIQEILFQLWRSMHRYDDQFAMSTWVYRIALNVSISAIRKLSRTGQKITSLPDAIEVVAREADSQLESVKVQQLYRFIGELKELDRALILLFLEQKSHKEMATILGLSTSNVATKLSRIKKKLAAKFASQESEERSNEK